MDSLLSNNNDQFSEMNGAIFVAVLRKTRRRCVELWNEVLTDLLVNGIDADGIGLIYFITRRQRHIGKENA